jgi:hypothetical protein
MSFPLICDVVAMLATVVHGWARHDARMRRLAALFVMGPMILSWAANAVDHLANAGVTTFGETYGEKAWTLWVVLAAGLCPVAVAALLYFATKFIEFEQRSAALEPLPAPETTPLSTGTAPTGTAVVPEEPEFIEPAPITLRAVSPPEQPLADDELSHELDELVRIEQVMTETTPKVTRDIAEIMVREGVSRPTAYRRRKERISASLA